MEWSFGREIRAQDKMLGPCIGGQSFNKSNWKPNITAIIPISGLSKDNRIHLEKRIKLFQQCVHKQL
jgi:hypothetical protein